MLEGESKINQCHAVLLSQLLSVSPWTLPLFFRLHMNLHVTNTRAHLGCRQMFEETYYNILVWPSYLFLNTIILISFISTCIFFQELV